MPWSEISPIANCDVSVGRNFEGVAIWSHFLYGGLVVPFSSFGVSDIDDHVCGDGGQFLERLSKVLHLVASVSVSYTHLTLPTNREV